MALASYTDDLQLRGDARQKSVGHPLRPVLITVFSLKLAVAAVLLGCVSLAPPVSAQGGYSSAD
ncbi:hypothetical protein ACQKGC_15410 [Allorhizobium pseudoryzae]|jgi:hypothetical protein|uniref:hypothetical protein n=1 Tax=Allorhizobium pseudoryzae TaxID=379684 RepID=UPI0013E9FCFC|nr:hypothetical protein [Allorhizobium pseudoryzae]